MKIKVSAHTKVVEPPLHNGTPHNSTTSFAQQDLAQIYNPSLQITADHSIKLVQAPVRLPSEGEVLIHVKATGICGSDVHFWKTGRIGPLVVEGDCILGHEAAGIILRVGKGVRSFKPGDRVAIEPGVPCGECFLCRDGRYNLCEDVAFSGVYPHDGTAQRYKCHPAKWVHRLPDNLSFAQGALLEPLSVAMHGISSCGLSLGRPTVVHGAGPIGLITLAAARASGAHPIVITDLEPKRLDFARSFVPSCQTYLVNRNLSAQANATEIRKLFGVASPQDEYAAPATVLECTGVESSIVTAAYTCRRGGTVMVIGVGKAEMNNLPFMHLSLAEVSSSCTRFLRLPRLSSSQIQLRFINRYRDTWPAGIQALSGGILNLDRLISHSFPLGRAVAAMTLSSDPANGGIKVQIVDDADVEIDMDG